MKNENDNKFKIYLYYGIMFLMVLFCIEILSQLTFLIIFNKRYSAKNLRSFMVNKYDSTDQRADFLEQEVIHPYVGYVLDFGNKKKNFTSQGFYSNISPVVKKEEGKVNIVVLGGSVATELPQYIEQAWKKTFKAAPRLINLALPGFKQPQQLMALTYFLSLGGEYDLVINVDGFNDIVLPYVENYGAGVNLFFPRSWELRINNNLTPQVLSAMGKVKYLQDIKRKILAELSGSIFNISATYGMVKMVQLIINSNEIYGNTSALFDIQKESKKKFVECGPVKHYANDTKMFEAVADFWFRCSLLINSLAKDKGFEYYHFLQPDQYLKGSKRLNREEKRIAYNEKHIYRRPVIIGYPLLIARGKTLVKNQVNFFDATMIFANIGDTIYKDDCCHINNKGYQILTDHIIEKISRHSKFAQLKPGGALPH
ncbi:MAG: hypothetical protein ACOZF2_06605 [Thermodesulfobacteriota bacterium]